jgi:hypothetical protein
MWPAVPGVPERVAETVPSVKIVYLVREPLARLRSHYLMRTRNGRIAMPFREFLRDPGSVRARCASAYGTQLQRFLDVLPREQVLVVETRELQVNRDATLGRVYSFIGADASFRSPRFDRELHVGKGEPIPGRVGHLLLRGFYRPAVRKYFGQRLDHVRRAAMRPLAVPPPSTDLPVEVERELLERLRVEVNRLRRLTGEALPSLGP